MAQVGLRGPYESMRLAFFVQGLTFSPADLTDYFFGGQPLAVGTASGRRRTYVPARGTIIGAIIFTYSDVVGTNENISLYVRKNNTTDYLIATVGIANNERVFNNMMMNVPMDIGDYFEIKWVSPTWVTNPANTTISGMVYFEV